MPGPRPIRERFRRDLQAALGVTRLARLTGLDRAGVEVVAAVRPGGHVLQVTNGKGESFDEAAAGALAEAAELWSAERPLSLVHGTTAELRGRFGARGVLGPEALAPADATPGWDAVRLA
ncbi:MAG TPA: YcaO-like family protein, partial [Anaeromyxobacteraceae bacterium]|nr:YcaO-like family protein [Anaeromyxobacteraceae bacterium]